MMEQLNSKKRLILTAFENLDADALERLLDDGKTYQDVPKKLFVQRYREYFRNLTVDDEVICDFKAYPGKCEGCSKGKTGYSFVNSQDTCLAELVFVESDDDFLDIYVCSNFNSSNENILDNYGGLYFCDDEKAGYMLTFEELVEKDFCIKAIQEIELELLHNKYLSLDFMKNWQRKYQTYYNGNNTVSKKSYTYISLLTNYLFDIRNILSFVRLSEKSKFHLELFNDPVFQDDEAKIMWLLACLEDIPDHKLHFHAKVNEAENYITFGKINFDLICMQDYLALHNLVQNLSYLLPHSILMSLPYDWKDPHNGDSESGSPWADDDIFPF